MARVNGPIMSMDASGSLGGVIVFSKWKGRAYVRTLVRPANPKSGGQVSMRASLKFLSQNWADISAAEKATWEPLADAGVFSPFNAFTKTNLKRNADFLAPSQAYPPLMAETPSAIDTFTATPGVRTITVAINDDAANDPSWGFLLFRNLTTGFTPGFDNLHAIILADGVNLVSFVDQALVPDTYYYDVKPFTQDGAIGALDGEINAVVA